MEKITNYEAGTEEKYLKELLDQYKCKKLHIENGIIYNDKSPINHIAVNLDLVEKIQIDIFEGYVNLRTSMDDIYIVDFINETIHKASI
jgi:hypothetical protein